MKIEWDGRAWEVDTARVTLEQAVVITGRMGCSLGAWEKLLADTEDLRWLDAMRCLYWLMVQQDGQRPFIGDVDFEVLQYAMAWADAIARETPVPDEPDPTRPPGTPGASPGEADSSPVPSPG